MDQQLLGNPVYRWVTAALFAPLVLLTLALLRQALLRRLDAATPADGTGIRVFEPLKRVAASSSLLLVVLSLYASSYVLELPKTFGATLSRLVIIFVLLLAALWCNEIISLAVGVYLRLAPTSDQAVASTIQAIGFLGKTILYVLVLLLMLSNLGINITALVTGLGIGGVAVAMAAQNLLGDLLGCVSIVLDRPFVMGDFIRVGDLSGSVEHLGLRTTRVRSLGGEQVVIPNRDLLNSRIHNYRSMIERRVIVSLGVTYSTGYDKMALIPNLLRQIVETETQARFDRAHFNQFGDSALLVELVYYVTRPDYVLFMDVQQRINLKILEQFEATGIDFAFPTQSVYIYAQPSRADR